MPCQRYFFIFQCIVPKGPTRRFDHFTLKKLYPSTFASHRVGIIASPYLPYSWTTASIKQTFLGYHTPLPELVSAQFRLHSQVKCEMLRHTCPIGCAVPSDRKSVVTGKSVSVRVDHGGRRILKNKKTTKH